MDYSTLTVPKLKEELKKRGLKVSGTKDELIKRLQADHSGTQSTLSFAKKVESKPKAKARKSESEEDGEEERESKKRKKTEPSGTKL
jgi:hypothetical protein